MARAVLLTALVIVSVWLALVYLYLSPTSETLASPSLPNVAALKPLANGALVDIRGLAAGSRVADSERRALEASQRGQWRAIVTLVTQREYLVGAYGLGASLRAVGTTYATVACLPGDLATYDAVLRNLSIAGFDYVRVVERLGNPAKQIGRLHQAHKVDVFTKLRVFQLTEFARVLYLDADTVAKRNVDALLALPHEFAVAPEVTPMWRCIDEKHFIFRDELQGEDWCHGHTRELYHGRMIKLSNTGVMLLTPSSQTFDELWALTLDELTHNDTCIGMAGCNDQRVINVYYDQRPYRQLSVLYNVFCDQFSQGNFSVFRHHKPFVFHYRGQASFKPWILRPGSPRESWNDECGAFVNAYDQFLKLHKAASAAHR
jgi:hypothetical protein